MTNFHSGEYNSDGENKSEQERVFRMAVIIVVIVAVLIFVSAGIYVGLKVLGSPTSTPPVSMSPTSSLDIDDEFSRLSGTATAACATFLEQFSGTPCPPMEAPNILATATQACTMFLEQFPGTPCPP